MGLFAVQSGLIYILVTSLIWALAIASLDCSNGKLVTVRQGESCWKISHDNSLSVDQLKASNPNLNCNRLAVGQRLCIPTSGANNCLNGQLVKVGGGDSCWRIADKNGISVDQLKAANPFVNCGSLQIGQQLCITNETVTSATTTTKSMTFSSSSQSPLPQINVVPQNDSDINNGDKQAEEGCKRWYVIQAGDTCWQISIENGLSVEQLKMANPLVNCNSLQLNQQVCVHGKAPANAGSPVLIGVCGPKGLQITVDSPTMCGTIADRYSMHVGQFQRINPHVDCDFELEPGEDVCVLTAPDGTLLCPGEFVITNSTEPCQDFLNLFNQSIDQFAKLNPEINCENNNNSISNGTVICLPLSLLNPYDFNEDLEGNGTSDKNQSCSHWHQIVAGDSCWQIGQKYNLSVQQITAANPDMNCGLLKVGDKLCVDRYAKANCCTATMSTPSQKSTITIPTTTIANQSSSPRSKGKCGNNARQIVIYAAEQTCRMIASRYYMTLVQLIQMNPKLECNKDLYPMTAVCVRDIVKNDQSLCPSEFVITNGSESCTDLINRFELSNEEFGDLNPELNCNGNSLLPNNTVVCVGEMEVTVEPLSTWGNTAVPTVNETVDQYNISCNHWHIIEPNDTCWLLWTREKLSEAEFRSLNPKLDCYNLVIGDRACLANETVHGRRCPLTFHIRENQTCAELLASINIDLVQLIKLNPKLDCNQSLHIGQLLCVSDVDPMAPLVKNQTANEDLMGIVAEHLKREHLIDLTVLQAFQEDKSQLNQDRLTDQLIEALARQEAVPSVQAVVDANPEYHQIFAEFDTQRPLICQQLDDSEYKRCICNPALPFLHCQALFFQAARRLQQMENVNSRGKRDKKYHSDKKGKATSGGSSSSNRQSNTPYPSSRTRFMRSVPGLDSIGGPAYIEKFIERMKTGFGSFKDYIELLCSSCFDQNFCFNIGKCFIIPPAPVFEICIEGGGCLPNPVTIIEAGGHISVEQLEESMVEVGVSVCITGLSEVLRLVGADACVASIYLRYFFLRQQLELNPQISLMVIRAHMTITIQVAKSLSQSVYDPGSKTVMRDMCEEEDFMCEDYCQLKPGSVIGEYQVEGWFFGWKNIKSGSFGDKPSCQPAPMPPPDGLERLVAYVASWPQYWAHDGTLGEELVERPDWCKQYAHTPKDLPTDIGITHATYAFLVIDPVTYKITKFENNDDELVQELLAWRASTNGQAKAMISIGGWSFCQGETSLGNDTKYIFSRMARDPNNRATFIQSAVDYVLKNNLDGIDIDWEYPTADDRLAFTLLMHDLREAIGRSGRPLLLTYAAPAGPKYYKNINIPTVNKYVDFVNLMSYDFHGGSFDIGEPPNVNAPIADCSCPAIGDIELAVEHYLNSGTPPSKLTLGLAVYGRTFKLDGSRISVGPAARGECSLEPGVLTWFEIKGQIKSYKVDPRTMSAYADYGENQFVGFDNQESLTMKTCFARSKRLGGLMIWAAEFDDNAELMAHISDARYDDCADYQEPTCDGDDQIKPRQRRGTSKAPKKLDSSKGKRKRRSRTATCGRPPQVKNSDLSAMAKCKSLPVGSTCKIVCKKDHKASPAIVHCVNHGRTRGKWQKAKCKEKDDDEECGVLPVALIKVYPIGATPSGLPLYVTQFNTMTKLPLWSLYAQTAGANVGNPESARDNRFARHKCHEEHQLTAKSYVNTGYDKGHLSPQNAFAFNPAAKRASNQMVNIAPQDGWTNSAPWRGLELWLGKVMKDYAGIVATGLCPSIRRDKGLPVPECYWKLVCLKAKLNGKMTETVAAFFHKNKPADTKAARTAEVKKVRDQAFVDSLLVGSQTSTTAIWATAAKLTLTLPTFPSPLACGLRKTHDVGNILTSRTRRAVDGEKQFWEELLVNKKYQVKWFEVSGDDEKNDVDDDGDDDDDDGGGDDSDGDDDGGWSGRLKQHTRCNTVINKPRDKPS